VVYNLPRHERQESETQSPGDMHISIRTYAFQRNLKKTVMERRANVKMSTRSSTTGDAMGVPGSPRENGAVVGVGGGCGVFGKMSLIRAKTRATVLFFF
jgi:hypothetical protein